MAVHQRRTPHSLLAIDYPGRLLLRVLIWGALQTQKLKSGALLR